MVVVRSCTIWFQVDFCSLKLILSNNMRSPSPEYYTTFWRMIIHSENTVTTSIDKTVHHCWPCYWAGPYYRIWRFTQMREVSIQIFKRSACQQTLTPYTWSCPPLRLAWVLVLRPISPKLVLFPGFWASNIPWYFYFTCNQVSIIRVTKCWPILSYLTGWLKSGHN